MLIQGPPGTGKTTVIAEICYQIALQGGRTLIASQANLAVDNALSRLIHSPVIRALRKGRAEKVEEEGLPFLEEEVIGTWLTNTAEDCENRLAKRKENIEFFRQLLGSVEKFTNYLKIEKSIEINQKTSQNRKIRINADTGNIKIQISEMKIQQTQINSLVLDLNSLLASVNSINWEDTRIVNLLERLNKYAVNDNDLKKFIANVKVIVNLAKKLGLVTPDYSEEFRLADWLRNNFSGWVSEARMRLTDTKTAIASISELEKAAQIYQQHTTTVIQLQRNYQKMRTEQQNQVFNQDLKVGLVVGNASSKSVPNQLFNEQLANLKRQMAEGQKQLENLRQQVEINAKRCRSLLTDLKQVALPDSLQALIELCLQSTSIPHVLAQLPELSAALSSWENDISNLTSLISLLDPSVTLSNIKNNLNDHLCNLQETSENANRKLADLQNQLRKIETQLNQKPSEQLISDREWWESAWKAIPDRLKPQVPSTGLHDPDFLRTVKAQFDTWQKELEKEEAYLNRYENIVQDWIQKLRNPSAQDRTELRRTYIDNANVIGITCVQAAGYHFAKEFNDFDVVIIDEVSKCTPPELMIPALKGKKLVLIGDYRQLPPMLHENSIEEIAEEMGSTREELAFLEESLFKRQFETAHESIKHRLNIQYRMHPIIMGAINQFYDHRLECGIPDADRQRAHNLNDKIIQENHHLIWVKMPLEQGFEERQEGTSRSNIKEVDVIERLCQQMEAVWAAKVADGNPRKEIGIITFYGAQLKLIEETIISEKFPSLQIRTGTVDRFQGMERAVVIVSMVRNNSKQDVGFAKKLERVNVAFSRAQELLIVVGCHSLFTQYARGVGSMYSNISDIVRRHGGLIDVSSIIP